MDGMQVVDRFQFHDDALFDQKVEFELALDALTFVLEGDMALALDTEVFSPHFDDPHKRPNREPPLFAASGRNRVRHMVHNPRNRAQVSKDGFEIGVRHRGKVLPRHRG